MDDVRIDRDYLLPRHPEVSTHVRQTSYPIFFSMVSSLVVNWCKIAEGTSTIGQDQGLVFQWAS